MATSEIISMETLDSLHRKTVSVVSATTEVPNAEGPSDTNTSLAKDISTRQFCLMAVGGSIGAGLLIGSSEGLVNGGPVPLVLCFVVIGFGVWCTMYSLSELSTSVPSKGSFYEYSVRFISPSWGFSMGWIYAINYLLIVPFELTVMIFLARYWNHAVSTFMLVPIFISSLFSIAASGAKWYAEFEDFFGLLKAAMCMTFSIAAIVIATGGVAVDARHGTGISYWKEAPFLNGIPGFMSVFALAGMAYGGTEMLGLTVGETKHPQSCMTLAPWIVAVRIIICYIIPLVMVGFVVTGEQITATEEMLGNLPSPFVAAALTAGLNTLADAFNGITIAAVFSMANASVFASSRALHAVCSGGMGPQIFSQTTKSGLPRNAIGVVFLFSMLAFVNGAPSGKTIFGWLLALASAANYFTWFSINLAHLRFRMKCKKLDRPDLIKAANGPIGLWMPCVGMVCSSLGLLAQMISGFIPAHVPAEGVATTAVQNSLGVVVVAGLWLGRMAYTKQWRLRVPLDEIAIDDVLNAVPVKQERRDEQV